MEEQTNSIHSRVKDLSTLHTSLTNEEDVQQSTTDFTDKDALHLKTRLYQILSDFSCDDQIGDLEPYLEQLQGGLLLEEAENAKMCNEIEVLNETYAEDFNKLESDLQGLKYSLDFAASQDLEKVGGSVSVDCPTYIRDDLNVKNAFREDKFEIMKLNDKIEKNNKTLNSLQDLDDNYRIFEAIEKFEDELILPKVLDFNNSCIKLSLTTYIPNLKCLSCEHQFRDVTVPSQLNHEFLIEVMNGTMELQNVEIFPNDVYVGEIIDATKSFRLIFSQLSVIETRSNLEWFLRKVQDRIILCTLRNYVIKGVNDSRHSFEYTDRDEMIVAHMVGGVDAFIKVPQGWPIVTSSLKLVSLKTTDRHHHLNRLSISFICRVEEVANSLDVRIRQNISSFVDSIEEIIMQQMSLQLHSQSVPGK